MRLALLKNHKRTNPDKLNREVNNSRSSKEKKHPARNYQKTRKRSPLKNFGSRTISIPENGNLPIIQPFLESNEKNVQQKTKEKWIKGNLDKISTGFNSALDSKFINIPVGNDALDKYLFEMLESCKASKEKVIEKEKIKKTTPTSSDQIRSIKKKSREPMMALKNDMRVSSIKEDHPQLMIGLEPIANTNKHKSRHYIRFHKLAQKESVPEMLKTFVQKKKVEFEREASNTSMQKPSNEHIYKRNTRQTKQKLGEQALQSHQNRLVKSSSELLMKKQLKDLIKKRNDYPLFSIESIVTEPKKRSANATFKEERKQRSQDISMNLVKKPSAPLTKESTSFVSERIYRSRQKVASKTTSPKNLMKFQLLAENCGDDYMRARLHEEFNIKKLTSKDAYYYIGEINKFKERNRINTGITIKHEAYNTHDMHPINIAIKLMNAFFALTVRNKDLNAINISLIVGIGKIFGLGLNRFSINEKIFKTKYFTVFIKERLLRVLYVVLNSENGLKVDAKKTSFKSYIGEGNNSGLVKSVLKQRWWWALTKKKEIPTCNFLWTQWRRNIYYPLLESNKLSPGN